MPWYFNPNNWKSGLFLLLFMQKLKKTKTEKTQSKDNKSWKIVYLNKSNVLGK